MYLITDICLGYLRVEEEKRLGKRGFRLITLVEGEEYNVMRGKTKTAFSLCIDIIHHTKI